METIQAYLTLADYQVLISKDEHIYLNLDINNKITNFKKSYFVPEIFMKDEIAMKNIGMKWNETTIVKIPKDIHLLGKIWVKVNIPYFQIIENLTTTTQTTTNNATINEMIFDNHTTYLIIYNKN